MAADRGLRVVARSQAKVQRRPDDVVPEWLAGRLQGRPGAMRWWGSKSAATAFRAECTQRISCTKMTATSRGSY